MSQFLNIEVLFKSHYKRLFRLAKNLLNDSQLADDVVQEVFISIWKNRDSIRVSSSIDAYLTKSTINKCFTFIEKNKKIIKTELNDINREASILPKDSEIDLEILQSYIKQSLDKLPPKCKAIFMLCRFENMKYKEVADHLEISIKTVENQMTIALSRLHDDLKPKLNNLFPEKFNYFFEKN